MSKYFHCTLDKPALSYKVGETMRFTVMAKENCLEIECRYVRWTLRGDDGKVRSGLGRCRFGMPLVLETTCDRPGFVHLNCKALRADGTEDPSFDVFDGGAGAEVDRLTYCDAIPDDFDDYWGQIEQTVRDFTPVLLQKTPYTVDVPEGFDCFDVRVSTPEGMPVSGMLTLPKAEGKYPLHVAFRGYSISGAEPFYEEHTVYFQMNAHGIENGVPRVLLDQKYPNLAAYGFDREENASPMTTYWRNMMLRNLIGLKFAKSLEQWDGKFILCSGGSQGALQATTVAAHDPDVSFLDIHIPWFCNLNAESQGYLPGWRPAFAEGLRYFDTVAQGTRVKCPVKITAYLGDYVCPPATVMTLYNGIRTVKSLDFIQGGTHGYRPPEVERFSLRYDPENPNGDIKPGIYRHFKGNRYQVIGLAKNSETGEQQVVYRALYGERALWVRPADMWREWVEYEGRMTPRFTYIGEAE